MKIHIFKTSPVQDTGGVFFAFFYSQITDICFI